MVDAVSNPRALSRDELISALLSQQQALEAYQRQYARKQEEQARQLRYRDSRIAVLEEQLRLALHRHYGRRTEARQEDSPQGDLFNEAETLVEETGAGEAAEDTAEATETVTYTRRKRRGRRALPAELARRDIEHDLPGADKRCACGADKTRIGEAVSERLEYIPAQLYVERHIRPKYACRHCEEGVVIAPSKPVLLPKSNAGPGLLAYTVIAKYQDSLPLYRQQRIFARHGVDLPRHTLANWLIRASEAMAPLLARLEAALKHAPVVLMDETPLQVNREAGRSAHHKSQMWVRRGLSPPDRASPAGRDITLYHYSPDRKSATAAALLAGCRGALMTDGYAGYPVAAQAHGLTHALCWAHARRMFVEAEKALPKRKTSPFITNVLNRLRTLYAIEHRLRGKAPADKAAIRAREALPVLEALQELLQDKASKVPPKTALGKAIHYTLGHWSGLTQYIRNGAIPIDNNGAENAIRPFVIGRNYAHSRIMRSCCKEAPRTAGA
jgi:transposase